MKAFVTLSLIATTLLSGCVAANGNIGPLSYDQGGSLHCSRDGETRACGYRVVHHRDQHSDEIWISNSRHGQMFYRVLHAQRGHFRSEDGASVQARHAGDDWMIDINDGEETYRLPRQDLQP